MNDKTWARIKKYTELQGTSGQEHIVRQQFRDELAPLVDEVKYEGLGGIFGVKQHLNSHRATRHVCCALG